MRRLASALVLLAVTTTTAWAQAPATTFAELSNRLHVGQTVVVSDGGDVAVRGTVQRVDDAALVLRVDGQDRSLTATEVQRVVRLERATAKGALIGFAVGFASGAASLMGEDCSKHLCLLHSPGGAVFVGSFFGAIGAGAGAMAGHAHLTKRVVFERPTGTHARADVTPLLSRTGAGLLVQVSF